MNTGNAMLFALLRVVNLILNFYVWALIISAILSWLVAFNIINTNNRFVQTVGDFLYRITEPVLRPIRRIVPPVGGFDLSPLVLILIIYFIQYFIQLRF
jgi:YggT family protein